MFFRSLHCERTVLSLLRECSGLLIPRSQASRVGGYIVIQTTLRPVVTSAPRMRGPLSAKVPRWRQSKPVDGGERTNRESHVPLLALIGHGATSDLRKLLQSGLGH
jgi:hypothetical protein